MSNARGCREWERQLLQLLCTQGSWFIPIMGWRCRQNYLFVSFSIYDNQEFVPKIDVRGQDRIACIDSNAACHRSVFKRSSTARPPLQLCLSVLLRKRPACRSDLCRSFSSRRRQPKTLDPEDSSAQHAGDHRHSCHSLTQELRYSRHNVIPRKFC